MPRHAGRRQRDVRAEAARPGAGPRTKPVDLEIVSRMAHEMLRAWGALNGDHSLKAWEDAPTWQRDSTMDTVRFFLDNPGADDGAMHEAWLDQKRRAGWTFGPVKDAELKQHPCIAPFEQLPAEQQFKDKLLRMVIGFGLSNPRSHPFGAPNPSPGGRPR